MPPYPPEHRDAPRPRSLAAQDPSAPSASGLGAAAPPDPRTADRLRALSTLVPPPVVALAHRVAEEGGRAYLVGGSVRDALLGRFNKDLDVEVFGLPVDALEKLLRAHGRVNAVGRSFGVLKWRPRPPGDLGEIDVSIPRRDSKSGPGHRGISVEGDPDMTIEEAVRRRDLTINAMMFDVVGEALIDPAGGLADLAARRLRAVDTTTFLEDPLRALRVIQFVARLAFTPDDALIALCTEAALDELPAERVQGEWRKLMLRGQHIARGFDLAARTRVLNRVFPRWPQPDAGPLLDALRPARDRLLSRDDPKREGRAWALMLTGWLAGADAPIVDAVLDALWLHRVAGYPVRDQVLAAVRHLHAPLATDTDLRHLSTHAEVELVASVRAALGDPSAALALQRATALGVLHEKPPPLLQGRHLRGLLPPGPRMGVILKEVYRDQLDGRVRDADEALQRARELLSG